MKKTTWLVLGILIFGGSASTQETPRADISIGYSYFRAGLSSGVNQQGGSVSVSLTGIHCSGTGMQPLRKGVAPFYFEHRNTKVT